MGTFHCDILEGGEEGPLFAVSLAPPEADLAAQVCHHAGCFQLQSHLVYNGLAEYTCPNIMYSCIPQGDLVGSSHIQHFTHLGMHYCVK